MEEIIMQQTENKKSEGRFSSELFGWGESLMAVLVFFVVVFTFFVRLIGVEIHRLAGRAKDMGSAAVFFALLILAAAWGLIALPALWALFF